MWANFTMIKLVDAENKNLQMATYIQENSQMVSVMVTASYEVKKGIFSKGIGNKMNKMETEKR